MSYEVIVDHPDFGHVVFDRMTLRQAQILATMNKILNVKKEGSDIELGEFVRELYSKREKDE